MNNDIIKHLEMISQIITRMASNSFMLKGWSITLVAALVALSGKVNKELILFSLFPLIIIWSLDAYYLKMERRFRGLFDSVRIKSTTNFSMDFNSITTGRRWHYSWLRSFLCPVLWMFYGAIAVLIIVCYSLGLDPIKWIFA